MIPRAIFALLIGTALLLFAYPAAAAIFNVANGDILALKNAITTANTNADDDTIELAANGTYTLTASDNGMNGLPQIAPDGGHKLTIHGNGSMIARSSATGTPSFRIFYINTLADVTISGLTMNNGGSGMNGATIYVNGGAGGTTKLTLTDSSIILSYGYYGGAIYNNGHGGSAMLIINNCTFSQNLSDNNGGAIYNDGALGGNASFVISNSTFDLNFTNANGGGAIQDAGFMGSVTGSLTNCTFNANYCPGNGAAIYVDGTSGSAALTITNCTFNQNTADGIGAIVNSNSNAMQLANNIFKSDGATQTIFNGSGTITSLGHNISDDTGGGVLNGPADLINTNPMLDPAGLTNNGGPTETVNLSSRSPAIDAGNDANAPARDQRSYLRSGVSDIGAVEFHGTLAPISAGSIKTHGAAGAFTVDLPLAGAAGVECRTGGATNDHQLVLTFASPVTVNGNPQAQVTSGVGQIGTGGNSNGGMVTINGAVVTVPLTNVANVQQITVTLSNVSDGVNVNDANILMRTLLGDTNGNSAVNASDVTQAKQQVGQPVTASNFRRDISANGIINASDVTIIKSKVGTGIP